MLCTPCSTTLVKGSWIGLAWFARYKYPKIGRWNWNSDFRVSAVWSNSVNLSFWRESLNDQKSFKSAETYFVVSSKQCTSTHIKESNWVTILIWKIIMSQHVNSMLPNRDKYFKGPKTALHSKLRPLYETLRSWIRSWSKNKVYSTPLELQLLFKVKL